MRPHRLSPDAVHRHAPRPRPFNAVRDLLDAPEIPDGSTTLAITKTRLDLTAEAIALRPEWQPHFTRKQRQAARRRLQGTPYAKDDV